MMIVMGREKPQLYNYSRQVIAQRIKESNFRISTIGFEPTVIFCKKLSGQAMGHKTSIILAQTLCPQPWRNA